MRDKFLLVKALLITNIVPYMLLFEIYHLTVVGKVYLQFSVCLLVFYLLL